MLGEHGFWVLLDAVINEPHKVEAIVKSNREILEATNGIGENVLRWFAVENGIEEVAMLRSMGSSIQSAALSEAVGLGHTRMVGMLLELGAVPELSHCRNELNSKFNKLTKRQKHIIASHFRDYGYELEEL